MIVPTFQKTASFMAGFQEFLYFSPLPPIWAINWCAIIRDKWYFLASERISQKVSVAKF